MIGERSGRGPGDWQVALFLLSFCLGEEIVARAMWVANLREGMRAGKWPA